jgi:hypothetical protein
VVVVGWLVGWLVVDWVMDREEGVSFLFFSFDLMIDET